MLAIKQTTLAAFDDDVLRQEGVVLVDFTARWCPPCRQMTPVLDRLAQAGVRVVEVDADAHPALSSRYGVRSLPTFVVFRGGNPVAARVGAQSESALASLLDEAGRRA